MKSARLGTDRLAEQGAVSCEEAGGSDEACADEVNWAVAVEAFSTEELGLVGTDPNLLCAQ